MLQRFTPDARRAVVGAQELARRAGAAQIEIDDLVAGVLALPWCAGSVLLTGLGVDVPALFAQLQSQSPTAGTRRAGNLPFSSDLLQLMRQLPYSAASLGDEHIGAEHLVLGALVTGGSRSAHLLGQLGIDAARYRGAAAGRTDRLLGTPGAVELERAIELEHAGEGQAALAGAEQAHALATDAGTASLVAATQNLLAWLITIMLIEERFDEALAHIDEALRVCPDDIAILSTRLAVRTARGAGVETIDGLARVLDFGDDVLGGQRGVSHSLLARAHLNAGQLDHARHHVEQAERHPTPWAVHHDTKRRLDEAERDAPSTPPTPPAPKRSWRRRPPSAR